MNIALKITTIGLLFLITIVSGIWIHQTGRPFVSLLFTIHKLGALAAVIYTSMVMYGLYKNTETTAVTLILIIITGFFMLSLLVSGSLLSFEKFSLTLLQAGHSIVTILLVLSTAATIYLLTSGKGQ